MNSFGKSRRLLKKSDYDYVFSNAKKRSIPEFTILYCSNSIGHSRLGLILPKKMIPKAHDRNRVKRLLRETFRLNPLPAIDVVILARKGVISLKNEVIVNKLGVMWKKLEPSCGS